MIQDVVSVKLPVGEQFTIRKNHIEGAGLGQGKRLCVITGTHGDELEGQYVTWKLARILKEKRDCLHGIVDIYHALNPLGVSTINRGIPNFDIDMNRMFPGNPDGGTFEYVCSQIIRDAQGADLALDIHASNIYLREIPQIRINELTADRLVPMAQHMNMNLVWVHSAATVLQSTLAYSLNMLDTPSLVVEMGVGMRITKAYGDQLVEGILATMFDMGMWTDPVPPVAPPILGRDNEVGFVNANESGVFLPYVAHGDRLREGEIIGVVADPLSGDIKETLRCPLSGLVFTLREYPVVYSGSLIARVLGGAR